jgi:hypothetical protein
MPFRFFNFSRDRHVDPPTPQFLLIKAIESNKNIIIILFLHPQDRLDRSKCEKEKKGGKKKCVNPSKQKKIENEDHFLF